MSGTGMMRPIATVFAFALTLLLVACQPAETRDLSRDKVTVVTPKGEFSWSVELADTPAAREKGLMFRKSMPRDTGMFFHFGTVGPVTMWMKNTFIPLDMIFAAPDGTIERVHTAAEPQSLALISSGAPVLYVLELNAGEAERTGLAPGQRLLHPWTVGEGD